MDYRRLLEVSRETGLPVKKVLDTLYLLRDGEPIENSELLRKLGVSRNVLSQVKEQLSSYLEPVSKATRLSTEGLRAVEGLFEKGFLTEEQLWKFLRGKNFESIANLLDRYESIRPSPKREYDQFPATSETVAIRAGLMDFLGDIRGKRLLFLGDNDLTSLAVASFGTARSIDVLDIDERILEVINSVADEQGFVMSSSNHNLQQPLPNNLIGRFDVVFTDPPYTPEGVNLFLSRAIQALDQQNQAARIYLCYGNSDRAKERFLPIHQAIIDSGLMPRWVFDRFNRYHGAESIGSASSLFVCDVTPKSKPIIRGTFNKPIYTNN